jgi:hypothetical protein
MTRKLTREGIDGRRSGGRSSSLGRTLFFLLTTLKSLELFERLETTTKHFSTSFTKKLTLTTKAEEFCGSLLNKSKSLFFLTIETRFSRIKPL